MLNKLDNHGTHKNYERTREDEIANLLKEEGWLFKDGGWLPPQGGFISGKINIQDAYKMRQILKSWAAMLNASPPLPGGGE